MPAPSIDNEKELLLLVSAGDEKAFHTLFNFFYDRIYKAALILTKSTVVSEEIVQDVFLKIWTRRELLPEINRFDSYLFILAKHHIYNELRKKIHQSLECNPLHFQLSDNSHADDRTELKETIQLIQHAVQQLPDQQRNVFQLSRIAGMDQNTIAKELHISRLTVKSHMTRALQSIRQYLQLHSYLFLFFTCSIPVSFSTYTPF